MTGAGMAPLLSGPDASHIPIIVSSGAQAAQATPAILHTGMRQGDWGINNTDVPLLVSDMHPSH